jgi:hypothetical protein
MFSKSGHCERAAIEPAAFATETPSWPMPTLAVPGQVVKDVLTFGREYISVVAFQYRLAMGNSFAGYSEMIFAPSGVSTTISSIRAAEIPSVAGQKVSTAKTIPAFNS